MMLMMKDSEKKLFLKTISKSKIYLEWGSGGSTYHAAQQDSIETIYSVESNLPWLREMSKSVKSSKIKWFHVNIGETHIGGFGWPIKGKERIEKYFQYSSAPFNNKHINYKEVDTILIDGRFRAACGLKTIEHFYKSNVKVMVHDFFNRLDHYGVLSKYFNTVDKSDTLGVFTIKDEIDLEELKKDYEKFKNLGK
jgi:hypothetical protein